MRRMVQVAVLGLAGYGGYVVWTRCGRSRPRPPDPRRVAERSALTAEELAVGSDDPIAQAAAILTESDERSSLPREAPGVERRRSGDTVDL